MYFICIYRSYLLFLLCRLQNKISTTIYTLNPIADIMAKVKPFKGVRPPRELVEEVASRPYDVLNSEEARIEAEGNDKSLYHIIKPEIDFEPGFDEHHPAVYDNVIRAFITSSSLKLILSRDLMSITLLSTIM